MNPFVVILPVLGGLIVTGLVGWLRKPRLIVFVPKLFTSSLLTDKGQLVEITIFNRGFKTEEAIELNFAKNLSYTIVGSNNEGIILQDSKCSIPRIGPSDEATILLLVEGGAFEQKDIQNCTSKETKGSVVDKFELVPMPAPQRVYALAFALTMLTIVCSMPFIADYIINKNQQTNNDKATSQDINTDGWKVPGFYERTSRPLYQAFSSGKIKVTMGARTRKKDLIYQDVTIENNTTTPIKTTIEMTSTLSESKIPIYQRRLGDIIVFPDKTETRKIQLAIPINTTSKNDRTIFTEFFIESDTDTLKATRVFVIND